MNLGGLIGGFCLLLPVVGARLLFLAPTRLGWINYAGNLVGEVFFKKIGCRRVWAEPGMASVGCLCLAAAGLPAVGVMTVVLFLLLLELYARLAERQMLTAPYTHLDPIGLRRGESAAARGLGVGYPAPSTHPDLTINVVAPFVERVPAYRLGTLIVGREFEMRLVIGNHTRVPTQTGIRVRVRAPEALVCEQGFGEAVPRLEPGAVHELRQRWKVQSSTGAGTIFFEIAWGHRSHRINVGFDDCATPAGVTVTQARITRYPGACRSAFAWRGDMDLYDESTLQSIEGLEVAFGLAARYRMPQTMYLSTRLSLDERAATEWAAHYGCDRGARRIPQFIAWMEKNVDLRHQATYPFHSAKRFVVELGNHGHLHFGTDTAGARENRWQAGAKMGAGVYPWQGEDRSSFGEQRDNALAARRVIEPLFGFSPKSWAMPNRTNDGSTAAAMEAAGCEVLSGSDVRPRQNVLLLPPPHYSRTTSAVELTSRYPGDPQHVFHLAMVTFWMHAAHRRGVPMIFMCHQHMRQFDGDACTRFTESLLRRALTRFGGDLHVNTVFGVGKYWREALGPRTRRIVARVEGDHLIVENGSDVDFSDVPVDLTIADGRRFTELVHLPAGERVTLRLPWLSGRP